MQNITFNALVVEEKNGKFIRSIQTRSTADLPEGELLIRVHYSSLNYKDGLSASGNKGITKNYPHTPGIDSAGVVALSTHPNFKEGEKVIVTSYDLGMNTPGGFGEYIRVPANWAVKLPVGLTLKESMIIGTAGFTAANCIDRLSALVKPEDGKIIVSGATGGVGSVAVMLLTQLGYEVVAITGKEKDSAFLKSIGANEIIQRVDFQEKTTQVLLSAQYAGAVDTVGGAILENMIKSVQGLGAITCCGNVASPNLDLTVFPFILRGISLIGVSTQNYPMDKRILIWEKLAKEWKLKMLDELTTEITLEELSDAIDQILVGKISGRTIVKMITE